MDDIRPAEHFTVEEFLALLGPHDTTNLELVDGRIYCCGEPFYDLVVRYLAALGAPSSTSGPAASPP